MTSRKIPESAVENLVSDLEGKANVANTVTTNTTQTISAGKKISIGGTAAYGRSFEIMMPTSILKTSHKIMKSEENHLQNFIV